MSKERNVIVHYHLFKNAGTSIDRLLNKNFAEKWVSFDGNTAGNIISCKELEKTISENTDAVAFSSHQIVPPLPEIAGSVFPVVFLRDPLDRVKSAYLFEWQKQLGLENPKGSLKEYVTEKFKNKRSSAVDDFQTMRLSNIQKNRFGSSQASDETILEQAFEFISSLSFIGIVDRFDLSVEFLEDYLKPAFPQFKSSNIAANTLQDITLSLEKKKADIHAELGDELFEMIVSRNAMDEKLYQYGVKHFDALYANQLQKNGQVRAA